MLSATREEEGLEDKASPIIGNGISYNEADLEGLRK
jgi:hypothetical protein